MPRFSMLWLNAIDTPAATLPAAWLIATDVRPANLVERSALRRDVARRILGRRFDQPADAIKIDHDEHGRPVIANAVAARLHLSLAMRAGIVAVALAEHPVGIDVERVDAATEPPLAVLHPAERAAILPLSGAQQALAFAEIWSAKEAYVKALGTGFRRSPESFRVVFQAEGHFTVDDPQKGGHASGQSRLIKNGDQEDLAAAMVVLTYTIGH